jgi:3-phenylpropionate/trans-cinnamate dioxygenase ferredoxin reductase component
MRTDVVIVGAGLGGLRTAEGLRRRGFAGDITMVGAETHLPYDRPPLTKQVLRGERDTTVLRDELDSLGITALLSSRAVALDAGQRELRLSDGRVQPYDSLVLATGAVPRVPASFRRLPGVHVVRTIEDAHRLREAARKGRATVVVGAGFTGCEVAASLRPLNLAVTLVELLGAPLQRVLGPEGAAIVTSMHAARGVGLRTGAGVSQILGRDRVSGVRLDDGTIMEADDVVVAIGVAPEVEWLADSGIALDDGITCNDRGETNLPGVYAVGDAAAWWYEAVGAYRRVEHWTTAVDQAAVVAHNITAPNAPQRLTQLPYFWSDQYDLRIQALGFVDPADAVLAAEPAPGRTVLLYTRDGAVRAAVGFGAARWITRLHPVIAASGAAEEALRLLAA